jgi:hypothetical protein
MLRAGQHEQRRLEGKRKCIATNGVEKIFQRMHWETFYHETKGIG